MALDAGVAGPEVEDQSLVTLACHLAASPVVLTDAEFDNALRLNSQRDLVKSVHYATMRALFGRFTDAAALALNP